MAGYTKLFSDILTSSIWLTDTSTRIVWITMLAMKDKDGFVKGSVGNMAHMARVTTVEAKKAIDALESPDEDSTTADNEGKRIERVQGGWIVLNHELYKAKLSDNPDAEKARERMRKFREKKRNERNVTEESVTLRNSVSVSVSSSVSEKGESEGDRRNSDFEECWKLYPRKDGKPQAHKAYNKYKPKKEDVIAGIKRYIAYVNAERARGFDLKYANGSTWFNQQRWESEFESDAQTQVSAQRSTLPNTHHAKVRDESMHNQGF